MNLRVAILLIALPALGLAFPSPLSEPTLAAAADDDPMASPIPEESRQLILVSAPATDGFRATLRRFERKDSRASWRAVSSPEPVVLGPHGLGAGHGLHTTDVPLIPKEEGDGKSPAGAFTLGEAFGFENELADTRLPYRILVESTECVDDASSAHYNQILERGPDVSIDWSSSEKMRATPGYELGIVIEHNTARAPRAGSCIFFHVWSNPDSPTAGCTAMSRRAMIELAEWVDPRQRPVVVQLPKSLISALTESWALPRER